MIQHKHLLINATIENPITSTDDAKIFLANLVESIDMKIIQGPFASYVDKEGNKGLTAIVMIETSHIAFHIWDEIDPALIQFDLYTCGQLELDKVMSIFKDTFNLIEMEYVLFDRENGFVVEQKGGEANGITYNQYTHGKEPNFMDQDALWATQQSFEE